MRNTIARDVLGSLGVLWQRRVSFAFMTAVTLAVLACAPGSALAQRACPEGSTPDYVTSVDQAKRALKSPVATRVPDDVCAPRAGPTQLPYFNDHSWRTFIALVWPALEMKGAFRTIRERGVPDPQNGLEKVSGGVPNTPSLVFETYKADWETFPFAGTKPYEWNDDRAEWTKLQQQCDGANYGDLFLAPSTAGYSPAGSHPQNFEFFDNVLEFAAPIPGWLLVAQNGSLVRYLPAYNQIEFNQILAKKWYLAPDPNEPEEPKEFLSGSLSVKSAWIDMGKLDAKDRLEGRYTIAHPESFHRRKAWLVDPYNAVLSKPSCEKHVVGLVGLHIVQKTPNQKRWVWATFEHVKNAPDNFEQLPNEGYPKDVPLPSCPTPSNPRSPYTFNSGTGPMWEWSFPLEQLFSAPCPPAPVDIERKKPINDGVIPDTRGNHLPNTRDTNKLWREALSKKKSVWQFYQLVMTQWCAADPGDNKPCEATIPGSAGFGDTAFANTTLETWRQKGSCMACHEKTRKTDSVWSLRLNAYDPRTQSRTSEGLKALQDYLTTQ